jgi:hypothetical protein
MHRADDSRLHVQYTSDYILDYFSYARSDTVSDRYSSEVAGPSIPNHLVLICADLSEYLLQIVTDGMRWRVDQVSAIVAVGLC